MQGISRRVIRSIHRLRRKGTYLNLPKLRNIALLASLFLMISINNATGGEPNTSALLGPNVYIFGPHSEGMQETISGIYAVQMKKINEFDEARYVFLFQPGEYNLDIRVGYYTQVLGLGQSPDDVTIRGAIRTQDDPATKPFYSGPGATTNFWRSAENLSIIPTLGDITRGEPSSTPGVRGGIPLNQNVWAVSQGAPLRRIHIKQSAVTLSSTECTNASGYDPKHSDKSPAEACPTTLRLYDGGWSSGGFMANSKIDGVIETGTQQQWFSRNCSWNQWKPSGWNMVFLGSSPVPIGRPSANGAPNTAITDAGITSIIREKPFLTADAAGHFFVMVPRLAQNRMGVDWDGSPPPMDRLSIDSFYIVTSKVRGEATTIDAAAINAALSAGKHLLFTPGVYYLDSTIEVARANTVILGLGMATLVANKGQPIMAVSDVDGVTIAGLIFEAGASNSPTLLQVGEQGSTGNHRSNLTCLYDVFCRVGGSNHLGKATTCVTINSNDVIGDNFWLWRADHGSNVGWKDNPADTGLIVNGARVTIYGLAVEHFQKYQTIWNGEAGRVYFYQSEMPYDPPSQADWTNPAAANPNGYASYKVGDKVTEHHAWGVGVYCFFRDAPVTVAHAVETPAALESSFKDLVTFWLSGKPQSEISHVINDSGDAVTEKHRMATLP
jgi:hypothetical protein